MEFEHITLGRGHGVWVKDEATFADSDGGCFGKRGRKEWEDGAENVKLHLGCC